MADCSHKACIGYTKCRSKRHHDYYLKNKGRLQITRKEYRETHKEDTKIRSRYWYTKNKKIILLRQKLRNIKDPAIKIKQRRQVKIECFNHYSLGEIKCNCCGVKDLMFLTLDHINNNGNIERKQLKSSGNSFYYWLRKRNYPMGYQVLCFNCNHAKYLNGGVCPHKEEVMPLLPI